MKKNMWSCRDKNKIKEKKTTKYGVYKKRPREREKERVIHAYVDGKMKGGVGQTECYREGEEE